jgi:hypothetical protein
MENKNNKYDYWAIVCTIAYTAIAIATTIFVLYYCVVGFPQHINIIERIAIIGVAVLGDTPFLALLSKD